MLLTSNPNAHKITKAVYLLLQQHHRTYGLGVVAWSKPPGNYYFTFYSLALRDQQGCPLQLRDLSGDWPLTIYQDTVGVPAWNAGRQLSYPQSEKHEVSTSQLLSWYQDNLALDKHFPTYSDQIARWRESYHVSQSEPFLLTWNVLGLFASAHGAEIRTYGCSEYHYGIPDWEKIAVADLGCANPSESVHFCEGLAFANNGIVRLPTGERLSLWEKSLSGEEPEEIAEHLDHYATQG